MPACRRRTGTCRRSRRRRSAIPERGHREESSMLRRTTWLVLAVVALLAWVPPADARVTRIVIDTTTPIAGQPYETLTGRAFAELHPADPLNAPITDIDSAQTNS